jgi:hypothetical protein
MLPKGYQVYVLFDTWYSSAKLIKFYYLKGALGLADFRLQSIEKKFGS